MYIVSCVNADTNVALRGTRITLTAIGLQEIRLTELVILQRRGLGLGIHFMFQSIVILSVVQQ